MSPAPQHMQAVAIRRFGGVDELESMTLPVPALDPGDVLIRVHTAGVGQWDPFEREGGYAEAYGMPAKFPYILGSEGSGVVEAVGTNVKSFAPGDRVYAAGFLNPKGGFYAQYVAVDASTVSRVPKQLSLEQAGVMSGVGMTALRGLSDTLKLAPGETLLLAGASGALGHVAIQLAKRMGARVLALASRPDGVEFARKLGADVAVDARANSGAVVAAVRAFAPEGLDAALLAANGGAIPDALELVRDGGRVAYPTGVQPEPEVRSGVRLERFNGEPDADIIERLNRLIDAGPFTVHIARTFPLSEAREAQRALAEHHLGKLALRVE